MLVLTIGHSSIQQPSMKARNVAQRINTGPVNPGSTQGPMHSQAFNPSARLLGQDDGVDRRSLYNPYTLPAAATDPQLTGSPRVIQYPSGMTRQQVMGNTSRAVAPVVEATHTGVVDNTTGHSVSLQSSSISNPNIVSFYGHSTNPVVDPVQSVEGYEHKFSNLSRLPPKSLMPQPSHLQPFTPLVLSPPAPPVSHTNVHGLCNSITVGIYLCITCYLNVAIV